MVILRAAVRAQAGDQKAVDGCDEQIPPRRNVQGADFVARQDGVQIGHRADLLVADEIQGVAKCIADQAPVIGRHGRDDRGGGGADHFFGGHTAVSFPDQAVQAGIAAHPEASLRAGGCAPRVHDPGGERVELTACRIILQYAVERTDDELPCGAGYEAVAVVGQPQPLQRVAAYGGHVAISRQVDPIAEGDCAGRIEIAIEFTDQLPVGDNLAVERAQDLLTVAEGDCPRNVVAVRQAVVDEVAVEEAVGALVGGRPEAIPPVDKDAADEVEARGQLAHGLRGGAVVEPNGVRIGEDELSLLVLAHRDAVVGGLEPVGADGSQAVCRDLVDPVSRYGEESATGADQ